jgi:hypothetical protein
MLEIAKLLGKVFFSLAGEFRPLGIDAVAISTMAGRTTGGFCLTGFRITRGQGRTRDAADEKNEYYR